MYIPNPVPEGHTETLQLTVIPQVLAWYIQYQHIYSTDIFSPNCWQHISNTNIYFHKSTFQTLCPKGTQEPSNLQSSLKCWHDISNINIYIQLTYTPQMVGSIYPIQIYIFINVHSKPCARRAHRNPPTYSHPLSVGMIYPISTYIFNWYILAWTKKKKNLDLGFALHRAVLYRYQDPPNFFSNL